MEDPESKHKTEEQIQRIEVNFESRNFLYSAAKWSKLLAVIGFVFVGILLLTAVFVSGLLTHLKAMNANLGRIPVGTLSAFYVFLALLYFFPSLYLNQFSRNIKEGIKYNSSVQLSRAFLKLKSFFKFWGILTLIIIVFYFLLIVMGVVGGLSLMNARS